jgi:hypothetical protein
LSRLQSRSLERLQDARGFSLESARRRLAALNHPHIAAIYGIESSAIVMEIVDRASKTGR